MARRQFEEIENFMLKVKVVDAPEYGLRNGQMQQKLVAIANIYAGESMEYTGRLFLSQASFDKYQSVHHSDKAMQLGTREVFIIAKEDALCGMVNHRCDCHSVLDVVVERNRAFLVATRNILAGEELTYDNGFRYNEIRDQHDISMQWMRDLGCLTCDDPIVKVAIGIPMNVINIINVINVINVIEAKDDVEEEEEEYDDQEENDDHAADGVFLDLTNSDDDEEQEEEQQEEEEGEEEGDDDDVVIYVGTKRGNVYFPA